MNIEIDKLTPCLERVSDKEIVDTTFSPVTKAELKTLKKWQFKWTAKDLAECEIYKLTVSGDDRIIIFAVRESGERESGHKPGNHQGCK